MSATHVLPIADHHQLRGSNMPRSRHMQQCVWRRFAFQNKKKTKKSLNLWRRLALQKYVSIRQHTRQMQQSVWSRFALQKKKALIESVKKKSP
jgi:hypothetical protein